VIAYVTTRKADAGSRALGFLATAPVAVPGIVLGVGLFLSYTRPPFVLYGTLWILLIAFLTINLPSAYQQLQAAFAPSIPSWRTPAASSARRGCSRCARSPRRCCAPA
jgi:iron(III) transport system permease protein